MTSHDLLAMLLFMHSRILLPFSAATVHCWLLHKILSASIPKPFLAFSPFIPQFVLPLGIASTQVIELTLGFVELHEVYMRPILKLVHISLDGVLSHSHINSTAQLGFISQTC